MCFPPFNRADSSSPVLNNAGREPNVRFLPGALPTYTPSRPTALNGAGICRGDLFVRGVYTWTPFVDDAGGLELMRTATEAKLNQLNALGFFPLEIRLIADGVLTPFLLCVAFNSDAEPPVGTLREIEGVKDGVLGTFYAIKNEL